MDSHEYFLDPCLCRPCKTAYSWFKIPAMLLACFCLLTWLSLVGRRAYLRRNNLTTTRPYCSLSDLTYTTTNRHQHHTRSSRSGRIRTGGGFSSPFSIWEARSYGLDNMNNTSNSNWCNLSSYFGRPSGLYSDGFRSTPPPPAYSSLKHIVQPPPAYSEIQSTDLLSKQCVNAPTSLSTTTPTTTTTDAISTEVHQSQHHNQSMHRTSSLASKNSPPSYSEVVLSRTTDSHQCQINDNTLLLNTKETETPHTSNLDTSNTIAQTNEP
ncbi:unnamed protein product [Schistosoma turkestanicum]|nr:unnamed protein product [Schistosoma turkestanicum]